MGCGVYVGLGVCDETGVAVGVTIVDVGIGVKVGSAVGSGITTCTESPHPRLSLLPL